MQAEAALTVARKVNGNMLRSAPGRRLRIAMLGYRSNPFSGGQGVYLKYLSRALVSLGHEVDVISGEPYPQLDRDVGLVKLPGLNLFEADNHVTALRFEHLKSFADIFEWFSMLTGGFAEPYTFGLRLKKLLKTHLLHYDVVHDNQSLCSALLDIQQSGIPLLTTIHHPITWDRDIALDNAENWGERMLIRRWHSFLKMQTRVASKLQHIVTVSESSRHDIASAFALPSERIDVVHNGIDRTDFYPLPAVERKPLQIISTASADQPLKGTGYLIRAFHQIRQELPQATLVLIGQPKPGGPNDQLIDELGLRPHISFHHQIENHEIRRLYSESSLAIVPSEYEGFGLPAGEAMACGVPVVSSDGGALPEVVGDAGLVVPVRNSDAIAQAALKILQDEDLRERLIQMGLQRIETQFSWQKAAAQMTEIYLRMLTEKSIS